MAIYEVVKKEDLNKKVATLYFPLMTGEDGKWYVAQELFEHPVLRRYVESNSIYYQNEM